MIYKILTVNTRKVIFRSTLRPADDSHPNYRLDPLCGEDIKLPIVNKPVLRSRSDVHKDGSKQEPSNKPPQSMLIINPADLVGCTFLLPERDDGQCFRAVIVEAIDQFEQGLNSTPEHVKF